MLCSTVTGGEAAGAGGGVSPVPELEWITTFFSAQVTAVEDIAGRTAQSVISRVAAVV
ncbi:MAG: hypothetical protein AMXMBFR83_22790 [Phycisphaerae bacterium]